MQPVAAFAGLALQSHHREFLDVWRLQVVRLDLFGVNILAIAQHDHFFFAPGEEEVPVRVEIAEVAGEEPSVAEDCGRRVRTVPITLHYHSAPQRDLANWGTVLLWRRVDDFAFDALHRLAD